MSCCNTAAPCPRCIQVPNPVVVHPLSMIGNPHTPHTLHPTTRHQGVPVVNALSKQRAMLENFTRACIGLAPESNMMLEFK